MAGPFNLNSRQRLPLPSCPRLQRGLIHCAFSIDLRWCFALWLFVAAGLPTTALSHPMREKRKLIDARLSKLISVVVILIY